MEGRNQGCYYRVRAKRKKHSNSNKNNSSSSKTANNPHPPPSIFLSDKHGLEWPEFKEGDGSKQAGLWKSSEFFFLGHSWTGTKLQANTAYVLNCQGFFKVNECQKVSE